MADREEKRTKDQAAKDEGLARKQKDSGYPKEGDAADHGDQDKKKEDLQFANDMAEKEALDPAALDSLEAEAAAASAAFPPPDDDGGAPDMAGLEAMMGGMGGAGGAGGMDMEALMAMMGKGGGKGGGMSGMGDMMGGKGGGKGGDAPADTDEKSGGEKWFWQQKGEEIQIRIVCDPPVTKKEVSVKFKSTSIAVSVRGESIVEGTLGGKVEVDECTWCLSADKKELQVMLTQVAGKTDAWSKLLA